jgi:hypothetical protein
VASAHTHGEELPFVDEGPGGIPESLILDIGDDVGALIVYAEECCLGMEIDLTPVGLPQSHHIHTMIRRRRALTQDFVAGVFPELRAGSYTLWGLDGQPLAEVAINGGAVAELQAGSCRQTPS